jgi:hypothetical protein
MLRWRSVVIALCTLAFFCLCRMSVEARHMVQHASSQPNTATGQTVPLRSRRMTVTVYVTEAEADRVGLLSSALVLLIGSIVLLVVVRFAPRLPPECPFPSREEVRRRAEEAIRQEGQSKTR